MFFVHIGVVGDLKPSAAGAKAVYDRVAQVRAAQPTPASSFPGDIATRGRITAGPIEEVFGIPVQTSSGMVKVVIGRTAKMHGTGVGSEMGVNTWI